MTAEEIASRARALTVFEEVEIDGEQVRFLVRFVVDEVVDEPHDVARSVVRCIQEELAAVDLRACAVDSDNDSVWGRIEEETT